MVAVAACVILLLPYYALTCSRHILDSLKFQNYEGLTGPICKFISTHLLSRLFYLRTLHKGDCWADGGFEAHSPHITPFITL